MFFRFLASRKVGHELTANSVCEMNAVVFFNESKSQLDSRRNARSRIKPACLHERLRVYNLELGKLQRNVARNLPMGCHFFPIEQASKGESVNSAANRGEASRLIHARKRPFGDSDRNV